VKINTSATILATQLPCPDTAETQLIFPESLDEVAKDIAAEVPMAEARINEALMLPPKTPCKPGRPAIDASEFSLQDWYHHKSL
jgi:hypothetical protein